MDWYETKRLRGGQTLYTYRYEPARLPESRHPKAVPLPFHLEF